MKMDEKLVRVFSEKDLIIDFIKLYQRKPLAKLKKCL